MSKIFPNIKRILIIQRRDIANPRAGGGVRVLHRIAKALAANGYEVTWISSNFPEAKRFQKINSVKILRLSSGLFFYLSFFFHYFSKFRKKYDLIVEAITPIPFFTPLYVRGTKKILIVYHLAKSSVFTELADKNLVGVFPAFLIYFLERLIPLVYRNIPILTFSYLTKRELLEWGVNEKNIFVAPEGIRLETHKPKNDKSPFPHIIHVGRIVKYKGIHHAIYAIKIIKEEIPTVQLSLVGDGPFKVELQKVVRKLGLEKLVRFHGFVSEDEKIKLLSKAHILLMLSVKEAWATPVIEANACGTVAIGFNTPGVRDVIKDGKTGFLVPYGNIKALAGTCIKLLKDPAFYEKMRVNALEWAKNFHWEITEKKAITFIKEVLSV